MTIIFNLITHLNMNYVSYVSGSIKNSFGFQNIGFVFVGRIIMYFIFLIFLKKVLTKKKSYVNIPLTVLKAMK